MVSVALAGDVVCCNAVVRQVTDRPAVTPPLQLVDVIGQNLPHALDVIDDANLAVDPLDQPDRHRVGLGASATKIPERPDWHHGIDRAARDALFEPSLG
jgi:hypothetical protein